MYCSRFGILLRMIPTLVRSEHVPEHEVRVLEFLAELALAIPPELARAISLDLACALDGGDPPALAAWYSITYVAQHLQALYHIVLIDIGIPVSTVINEQL